MKKEACGLLTWREILSTVGVFFVSPSATPTQETRHLTSQRKKMRFITSTFQTNSLALAALIAPCQEQRAAGGTPWGLAPLSIHT